MQSKKCAGFGFFYEDDSEDECYGCRYGSCNTCPVSSVEFRDELSDEALAEFEEWVSVSEPLAFVDYEFSQVDYTWPLDGTG